RSRVPRRDRRLRRVGIPPCDVQLPAGRPGLRARTGPSLGLGRGAPLPAVGNPLRARSGQRKPWPRASDEVAVDAEVPAGLGWCPSPATPSEPGMASSEESPVDAYSHSIVAGGFELMSRATRLTPATSLMIRFDTR